MIEDSASNNHMHHSSMPEPIILFLIDRIENSCIEQVTPDYGQQLNVMGGSNAQPTLRRLIRNLRQIYIQLHPVEFI